MTTMAEVLNPKIVQLPQRFCASGKVTAHSNRPDGVKGRHRSSTQPIALEWVTLQTYAVSSGYTEGALYQKIRRGHYIEGKHFRKAPDGRIHMNVQECQNWGFCK